MFYLEQEPLQLRRIPRGIERFFPNLIALAWIHGNVHEITADELQPLPQLSVFSIWDNKLVSVDGDLFIHTPNIMQAYFNHNQLQHVGFGLLDDLDSLWYARFNNNSCIDLDGTTPEEIQELKVQLRIQCPPQNVQLPAWNLLKT